MTVSRRELDLSPDEEKLFECLDKFVCHVRATEPGRESLEARIAGGWVRDKLLHKPCFDCDVAIANMKGLDFAVGFVPFYQDYFGLPPDKIKVAEIKANPEQSKHLDTATVSLMGQGGGGVEPRKLDLDFCQLRSEEYGDGSRIPSQIRFGTPLEDALRRDLTINSLFYNVHTQMIEDHTERGLADLLEQPLIRTPLEPRQTFMDDPLRILRCIRFAVRLGFPLNDNIREAVQDPEVRDALASKVSKERVGIEVKKMLSSSGAVEAIEHVVDLGLYSLVFSPPQRLDQPSSDASISTKAARTLQDLLRTDQASPLGMLPAELISGIASPDIFELYLACALLPYRRLSFVDKKGKTVVVAPNVISEALKLPNDDAQYVAQLFMSAELVDMSKMDNYKGDDERVDLGLLLPALTGIKGPSWRVSLTFCLLLDLLRAGEPAKAAIQTYADLCDRIIALGLDADAFAKPVLNGRDAIAMGVKGKAIDGFLKQVMRWQLAHPGEGVEPCRAHMTEWLAKGGNETVTVAESLAHAKKRKVA